MLRSILAIIGGFFTWQISVLVLVFLTDLAVLDTKQGSLGPLLTVFALLAAAAVTGCVTAWIADKIWPAAFLAITMLSLGLIGAFAPGFPKDAALLANFLIAVLLPCLVVVAAAYLTLWFKKRQKSADSV